MTEHQENYFLRTQMWRWSENTMMPSWGSLEKLLARRCRRLALCAVTRARCALDVRLDGVLGEIETQVLSCWTRDGVRGALVNRRTSVARTAWSVAREAQWIAWKTAGPGRRPSGRRRPGGDDAEACVAGKRLIDLKGKRVHDTTVPGLRQCLKVYLKPAICVY